MQKDKTFNKADRNKIYFLVVVIASLLGINGYLYFKSKQENSQFITVNTEKDRLKLEVEKIEVELDKVTSLNVTLGEKLQIEQKIARDKIAALKLDLQKGEITQGHLNDAKQQVKELKEFVKNYNDQVIRLEKENSYLKTERDSLKTTASLYNARANSLEKQNQNLQAKVLVGAALKAINTNVEALKVKDNGKSYTTSSASSANKMVVKFSIAPNPLAKKAYHKIYLRVFDPAGNLIADDFNMFKANGQKMQYSTAIDISYNDDNTIYVIDWINPKAFLEGTYGVILYTDGVVMGKADIKLK